MAMKGNAQGLGGGSKQTPLGSGQKSSYQALGIDMRVECGTVGSRENMTIGGEEYAGTLFKGNSVGGASKESNSGGSERDSMSAGHYGPGSFDTGTVGSRENMTLGGDKNVGKLVGEGANSTGLSSFDRYFSGLPTEPGLDIQRGTSDGDKNLSTANSGIGSGKMKLPKSKD